MTLAQQFDSYRAWRDQVDQRVSRLQEWLEERDLLDNTSQQRLQRIRSRLAEDKLVVAFVAEFSRGKSELINALFFADRGGRVLPSSAGRTTMCPTEIAWETGQTPRIALLPIETRAEGASVAELRGVPEAWVSLPLDASASAEAMAETLSRVGEVKHVPAEAARGFGFAVGSGDGDLAPGDDGLVEIPRWRHALISFPHPLLAQGLIVLDTPGLNAIGAEPELTLSLLPGAHAVLFILAADTGVTQTDLTVWRDHVGGGPGRLVVLNKIDGLWDGLRSDDVIDGEIARQVESCGRILDLPTAHVFPVSAQKGLVAKINDDDALLARSRLPRLEQALAEELLPAKREIVARGTAADALALAGETRKLLETRRAALGSQYAELVELRGKNENVVAYLMSNVKAEKEAYERNLREYYAVRSVFSQLSDTLFGHLGMENLRAHGRRIRDTMRDARFTAQLISAMGELFAVARGNLERSEASVGEVAEMMTAMRARFGSAYGVELDSPPAYTLAEHIAQINALETAFRRQFGTVLTLLTRDKRTLIQQFFETIASQMRKTFERANRDTERWLRTLMAPMENQVREVQRQVKHRLENVRRVHEATDSLEERIEDLAHDLARIGADIAEMDALQSQLDGLLVPTATAAT